MKPYLNLLDVSNRSWFFKCESMFSNLCIVFWNKGEISLKNTCQRHSLSPIYELKFWRGQSVIALNPEIQCNALCICTVVIFNTEGIVCHETTSYDWISLWKIAPYDARNSRQLFRVKQFGKRSTILRQQKLCKHKLRNITATFKSRTMARF